VNFDIPETLRRLQERTREFIANQVIPLEGEQDRHRHGPAKELGTELVARARRAGLLTPRASNEMGGLGLSHRAKALVFAAAADASEIGRKAEPLAELGWACARQHALP
jgi:acyl-CoA dehydrogenase